MVTIPVSVGELVDKHTILLIKRSKVLDSTKVQKIQREIEALNPKVEPLLAIDAISVLHADLMGVNAQLWDVEDKLRKLEKENSFGDQFVSLARAVYHLNDERFSIKNKINTLTDSEIQEVKQYIDYK